MRRILIVGAGQAGLMLALGLQQDGYEVTVISARTPEDLRHGRVMSTRYMFGPALALERSRGLHLWDDEAPRAVGRRVTLAAWLELSEDRGGRVAYRSVSAPCTAGSLPSFVTRSAACRPAPACSAWPTSWS
ncbi:FAD-dependent monooxygenase [Actinoallomurus acaciae]|uniref:FAD-dependent monooxygenase n=1 Tax=Actinoallomurus acaciae TaxID=502577 RepID=A0ABV5Y8F4_9ACTN